MFLKRQFLAIALIFVLACHVWGDDTQQIPQTGDSEQSLQNPQNPQEHAEYRHLLLRESARNAKNLGNVPRSLELYKELITEFPGNKPDLHEYLGTLMQLGEMHEAALRLEQELKMTPDDQDLLRLMVDVQLGLRELDQAESFAQKLLELIPEDTAIQLKLAGLLAQKKQWGKMQGLLQKISPDVQKPNTPFSLELAEIYLLLGDEEQAGEYLLPILQSGSFNTDWNSRRALLLGIWFYAKQGDATKTGEYLQKLDEVIPVNADYPTRVQIIGLLIDHQLETLARKMADQLAQAFPKNLECFLILARIDALASDPVSAANHFSQAERLLGTPAQPNEEQVRLFRLLEQTKLTLHENNSEHIQERRLLREMSHSNPIDFDSDSLSCWKRLGDTYAGTGEYDKAELIYRRVIVEAARRITPPVSEQVSPDCSQIYTEAVLASQKLLESLSRQRKGNELSNTYYWICSLFPDLSLADLRTITLVYAGEMIRNRRADAVGPLLSELVQQGCCSGKQRAVALTLLGDTAYYAGEWDHAMWLYEEATGLSEGYDAAVYGMVRILQRQCPSQVPTVLENQLSRLPNPSPVIVAIYYRAMEDGDKHSAVQVLNVAQNCPAFQIGMNPQYQAAWGHWYLTTGGTSGAYAKAIHLFKELCTQYPDNITFRKSLLDAYSAARQFSNALNVQRQLLADDPYHLEYDLIGLRIQSGMLDTFEASSLYNRVIQKHRHSSLDFPELATLEEEIRGRETQILALERDAWINRVNRPEQSNQYYEQERRLRLYDEAIPYQMGVNCDAVARTSEAGFRYRQSLAINPFNRYDHHSLQADAWRLRPQLLGGYEFHGKHGRDGLADIREHRIPAEMMVLRNNLDEYISAGYAWSHYETHLESHKVSGHSFLFSYRKRGGSCRDVQFFTDLETTGYDQFLATRPQGNVGVVYNPQRDYSLGISGRLQQVMENAGTIEQDIYRFGVSLFGEWNPTVRWGMDGSLDYLRYSDNNDLLQLTWNNKYLLWSGPKQRFDLLGSWNFQNFRDSITAAEPDILTMRHPYFAPAGYHFFDGGCRWEWQIAKHPYNGIQEKTFFLEYRHRLDTRNTHYDIVQTGCRWDVSQQLRLEGMVRCVNSQPYDEYGFQVGGTWRF